MTSKMKAFAWMIVSANCLVIGCQNRKNTEQTPPRENVLQTQPAAPAETGNTLTDQWLGKWIGPEGTFLELAKNGNKYSIKINSLDGPATYEGIALGDHIVFQRERKSESIRAGNGVDTGMKWLLDKKNCLIVKTGEGFCR